MGQIPLFAAEPVAAPVRHRGGMPPCVERMIERACSPEVKAQALAIFQQRAGEWLRRAPFLSLIKQHDISSQFGRVTSRLERAGLIEARKVYLGRGIGAESPGSENYQGFDLEYRLAQPKGEA